MIDLQAFTEAHHAEWYELDELTRRRKLSPADVDRLIEGYQRTSAHLATLQQQVSDPRLVAWLSTLVTRARQRALQPGRSSLQTIARFFTHQFPGSLHAMRHWWITTTIVCFLVMAGFTLYYLQNPQIESSLLTAEEVDQLVNSDFENYYSEYAASSFALRVWTNNAWIAALCIATGFLGFPVIQILFQNCINVALTASIMIHHGRAGLFFGLITPHGLLELTAVFVAAAVGLRVFWSWVVPGDLSRAAALAKAGRSSMTVIIGITLTLLLSGLIEAFVTPAPIPTWARITIGVVAWVAFCAYPFLLGRSAAAQGSTGDIEDVADRGATEITRA